MVGDHEEKNFRKLSFKKNCPYRGENMWEKGIPSEENVQRYSLVAVERLKLGSASPEKPGISI